MKTRLLLFLKAPRPGEVKTRLARDVGAAEAVRIYRRLAERQLSVVPVEWENEIFYTPRGARAEMRTWLGARRRYRVQSGGDLGARLSAAFARAFRDGASLVLAIGADCPGLDAAILHEAASALTRGDVVLGPARDGGYYLIGLRRPAPELFDSIPWSTERTLAETRSRARAAGLSVELLRELEDVDDLSSLLRSGWGASP